MCPSCLLRLGQIGDATAVITTDLDQVLSGETPGEHIGRYRLLEPIGEGGCGTVWMAEQFEPVRRKVALKLIKLGMDTKQVVARFEAERQALALMDHQNIARVFDGGATESGRPYFVMELVRGIPLTAYCDTAKLNVRERVELFVQVCQAVQHAHQKGIIHRDLKPTNVLVTEQDGKPLPKVIDFGIAKATGVELTEKTLFTRLNQMIGTPVYMSPEQAGLGSLDIDTRTDIYSLGVLLYELLTGRTPLDPQKLRSEGYEAILKTIREVDPTKPSTCLSTLALEDLATVANHRREEPHKFRNLIRGDLDWIALKALEKDRTRRYASAQDLAADLQRFLNNEPIVARPPSTFYRFQKLARRNKLAFATGGAVLAALIVGLIATSWQWARATRSLRQADLSAYVSDVGLAQQALTVNNVNRALELLDRQRPKPGQRDDLRGFEWRYLWQQAHPQEGVSVPGTLNGVSFSPDGQLLALTEKDQISIREMPSRRVITNLPGVAISLEFSPRDKVLATADFDRVRLWNTETWQELRPPLQGVGFPVRFSPDGAWLLTGDPTTPSNPRLNPKHQLWSTDTWEPVASCSATPEFPWQVRNAVAFSPDGSVLATPWVHNGQKTCTLRFWKVPSLDPAGSLPPDSFAWAAAFLPDGRHVVVGTFFGEQVVWDWQQGLPELPIKVVAGILPTVSMAPDGSFFIAAGNEGTLTVWDTRSRQILNRFRGYTGGIWASTISPDSRVIATGGFGAVRLWDAKDQESASRLRKGGLIAGFTPDSGTLVLAPSEHDYRWHLIGREPSTVEVPTNPAVRVSVVHHPFDAVGDLPLGALGRVDGSVEIWDLSARRLRAFWPAHTNEISVATLSPDGTLVATGDVKGQVKLWNASTGGNLASFDLPERPAKAVAELVFSPDGKTLAGGWWPSGFSDVVLWDVKTRTHLMSLTNSSEDTIAIAFSPDGRLLVGGPGGSGFGNVWELPSGHLLKQLKGHVTSITDAAFSPDGQTLVTGSYETLKFWNVATLEEVASLPTERAVLHSLAFSPDGRTLAAGYLDYSGPPNGTNQSGHFVRLYHAPSLKEIAAIEATEKKNDTHEAKTLPP
ncbi:MAG TPA: protein kinase [Verrucomicrobiota bacterium]|nr:protein kinase [Verrucomicrobiota bacterium]